MRYGCSDSRYEASCDVRVANDGGDDMIGDAGADNLMLEIGCFRIIDA